MTYKNSILIGTIGGYHGRFYQFQPASSFADRLAVAKAILKTHGIEPVFPQDLGADEEVPGNGFRELIKALL